MVVTVSKDLSATYSTPNRSGYRIFLTSGVHDVDSEFAMYLVSYYPQIVSIGATKVDVEDVVAPRRGRPSKKDSEVEIIDPSDDSSPIDDTIETISE